MKQHVRRLLALGCVCTLLVGATAMALPADEDAENSTVDITVDTPASSPDGSTSNEVDSSADSDIDIPMIEPGDNRVDAPLSNAFIEKADAISTYTIADIDEVQIVALKNCNLYKGAGTATGDAGTMPKGTVRMVSAISGKFYKIIMDGESVWVHVNNIGDATTATITVTAKQDCNVYSEASSSSGKVETLSSGASRTVLNFSGNFYKIKVNGTYGWVKMNTGKLDINIDGKALSTHKKIANLAKMQLGKDYVWGATGPNSFDCSGLAKYCYNTYGITSIPRVSYDQYSQSHKVSKSNLKPGYLLFFSSSNGGSSVSHVGIYIGQNKMVHAANSRVGTIVSSVADGSDYAKKLVGCGYFS